MLELLERAADTRQEIVLLIVPRQFTQLDVHGLQIPLEIADHLFRLLDLAEKRLLFL